MVTMGRLFFLVVAFGAGGLVVFLGQPSDVVLNDRNAQYQDAFHAQHRKFRAVDGTPHDSLAAEVWPTQPGHGELPAADKDYGQQKPPLPIKVQIQQLPYSADCGNKPNTLVIGILASPSSRSGRSRETIRQTWGNFRANDMTVTIRFLLALDVAGNVPDHIAREAELKGDVVLLETHDLYANLGEKVRLFFQVGC